MIQEKDIISCDQDNVTFRYIDSATRQVKTRTVRGEFFLFLLMQHVLPKGFRRVRAYGFLHPCSKRLIKLLQLVLRINPMRLLFKRKKKPAIRCPICGSSMEVVKNMVHKPLIPALLIKGIPKKGAAVM